MTIGKDKDKLRVHMYLLYQYGAPSVGVPYKTLLGMDGEISLSLAISANTFTTLKSLAPKKRRWNVLEQKPKKNDG